LVNGFVATYFSGATRATALGITLGIGRIGAVLAISGGGVLVAATLGNFINFSVWAVAAAIGVVAVLTVPRLHEATATAAASPEPLASSTAIKH
jgi:MFS transporter, AAHS family, benzoate transport protein